jgi:hypothetical protein
MLSRQGGVGIAEKPDKLGQNLFNGGFPSHHLVGDVVHLLDVPGARGCADR